MRLNLIALVMFAIAGTVSAQEPWSQRPEERQETVLNEDGGRAFLIRPAAARLPGIMKPGAPISQDLQQQSIFLGGGWSTPALHSREARLSKLLVSIHDHAQMDEVTQAGITNRFGATFSLEKLDIAGERSIGDLEIQGLLARMFDDDSLTMPGDDTIYFVFLDPGLHSTLGDLKADKHYTSYHSYFNVTGAKIHYVVIPFQQDAGAQYQTGLRALLVAALHSSEESN
jgi:hypothetical protein